MTPMVMWLTFTGALLGFLAMANRPGRRKEVRSWHGP